MASGRQAAAGKAMPNGALDSVPAMEARPESAFAYSCERV